MQQHHLCFSVRVKKKIEKKNGEKKRSGKEETGEAEGAEEVKEAMEDGFDAYTLYQGAPHAGKPLRIAKNPVIFSRESIRIAINCVVSFSICHFPSLLYSPLVPLKS